MVYNEITKEKEINMGYLNTSNRIKGKYRVLAHFDIDSNDFFRNIDGTLDSSFDDLYIPCKSDSYIYWFGNMAGNKRSVASSTLCAYFPTTSRAKNLKETLEKEYPQIHKSCYFDIDKFSVEGEILFDAKYVDVFAKLMGASVKGKDISPFSVRNLPKEEKNVFVKYSIGADYDKELFTKYVKSTGLKLGDAYLELYKKIEKKLKIDFEKKAKLENYKPLHWLHKNGYWGEVNECITSGL